MLGENKLVKSDRLFIRHKINKSNTKVSTPYGNIGLYSTNISDYISIIYEFLNLFWNVFNSKTVIICYIISMHIPSYPMSSHWFVLVKFCKICPHPLSWVSCFLNKHHQVEGWGSIENSVLLQFIFVLHLLLSLLHELILPFALAPLLWLLSQTIDLLMK